MYEYTFLTFYQTQARALKVSPGPSQATGPVPNPPGKQKLSPVDAKAAQQTDEILNSILPPRYAISFVMINILHF